MTKTLNIERKNKMEVTTSASGEEGARSITLEMPCAKDIAGAVKMDGEEIVYNYYVGQKKVSFQGWVRRMLKDDVPDKEITAKLKDWKPGLKKPGKSAVEKAKDAYAKLSPEDKKALLASLQ
jgi:hypothetical protein